MNETNSEYEFPPSTLAHIREKMEEGAMLSTQVEMLEEFNDLLDDLSREGRCGCAQSEFLSAVSARYANALRGCYTQFPGQSVNELQEFARQYADFMIEVCDMYESVVGVHSDE